VPASRLGPRIVYGMHAGYRVECVLLSVQIAHFVDDFTLRNQSGKPFDICLPCRKNGG
jgi:hypothetical protein